MVCQLKSSYRLIRKSGASIKKVPFAFRKQSINQPNKQINKQSDPPMNQSTRQTKKHTVTSMLCFLQSSFARRIDMFDKPATNNNNNKIRIKNE